MILDKIVILDKEIINQLFVIHQYFVHLLPFPSDLTAISGVSLRTSPSHLQCSSTTSPRFGSSAVGGEQASGAGLALITGKFSERIHT